VKLVVCETNHLNVNSRWYQSISPESIWEIAAFFENINLSVLGSSRFK